MRVINAGPFILQFDADEITDGSAKEQVNRAIELVNFVLQREPYGLGAQLYREGDLEILDEDEDKDENLDTDFENDFNEPAI